MAVGFGSVHPDPASKGKLIHIAKLLARGSLLRTSSFEKTAIIPFHHSNGNAMRFPVPRADAKKRRRKWLAWSG